MFVDTRLGYLPVFRVLGKLDAYVMLLESCEGDFEILGLCPHPQLIRLEPSSPVFMQQNVEMRMQEVYTIIVRVMNNHDY